MNAFDPAVRQQALERLAATARPPAPAAVRVNMHLHSFFSFNTLGHSPARLAWEARRLGLYAAALCDFDMLDGLEEFLHAGLRLGLRTAVHLETRAGLEAFASVDINSPGEPGVTYIMGAGFPRAPAAGSPEAEFLAGLRRQADARNRALAARINARLPEIALDYERDVRPLSPASCPTERHLVRAYRLRAAERFPDPARRLAFWNRLGRQPAGGWEQAGRSETVLEEAIRAALAKRGGLGYEPPSARSFPPAADFCAWALACQAIPMATWLDGTSAGESDMGAMLDCLQAMGAAALNIIPDRNHNLSDPDQRARKLRKLEEVVRLAVRLAMPINIGTEMNKAGQPEADDLDCAALRPHREVFLRGARFMIGQSLLARYADFSYSGAAARAEFGEDRQRRNACFEAAGALPALTLPRARRLAEMGPGRALAVLRDSAARGDWTIAETN